MKSCPERAAALALLRKYNTEPFHLQHALTVESVMGWYARDLGYGEEADFWSAGRCWRKSARPRSWFTPCAAMATASAPTWSPSTRWKRSSSPPTS